MKTNFKDKVLYTVGDGKGDYGLIYTKKGLALKDLGYGWTHVLELKVTRVYERASEVKEIEV